MRIGHAVHFGATLVMLFCAGTVTALPQRERETVRVGIYDNPPKIYRDADEDASGFHVEVLEEIASRQGWELEFVYGPWHELLTAVDDGAIDIMPDVAWSRDRAERFIMSEENIFVDWAAAYRRESFEVASFEDFDGARVAGMIDGIHVTGSGGILNLTETLGISIDLVPTRSYSEAFELLERSEVDIAIVNRLFGSAAENEYDVRPTSLVLNPVAMHYALPRDSDRAERLRTGLDASLRELKGNPDSSYYRILDGYLAGYVAERPAIPPWLISTLLAALLAIAFLIWLSWSLRREVSLRHQREKELEQAKRETDEANRAQRSFLANMTHEIRTPMNAILGYSEILQSTPGLSDEQRHHLSVINSSGEHLLELINEVLDMSRIEAGKTTIDRTAVSLQGIVRQTLALLTPTASRKGLSLTSSFDSTLPALVWTDKQKLRQILINLLNNAIKFSSEGEIRVSVSKVDGDPPRCTIAVSDQGPGIDAADRDRIFGTFEQSSSAFPGSGGTGLGLSISRRYAELLGGSLEVSQSGPDGSTFTLTLSAPPADDDSVTKSFEHTEAGENVVIAMSPEHLPKRLLLVDDRETNLDLLVRLLRPLGFDIDTAPSGRSALELLSTRTPDAVLTDVVMPEMDGIALTAAIRARPECSNVAIVGLTASSLDDDVANMYEAGADRVLSKPYRSRDLLEALSELLGIEYEYGVRPGSPGEHHQPETTDTTSSRSIPGNRLGKARAGIIRKQARLASKAGVIKSVNDAFEAGELTTKEVEQFTRLAGMFDFARIIAIVDQIESRETESGEGE